MFAAMNAHANIVKLLITHGADINAKDRYKRTALTFATRGKHKGIAELLRKENTRSTMREVSAKAGSL